MSVTLKHLNVTQDCCCHIQTKMNLQPPPFLGLITQVLDVVEIRKHHFFIYLALCSNKRSFLTNATKEEDHKDSTGQSN